MCSMNEWISGSVSLGPARGVWCLPLLWSSVGRPPCLTPTYSHTYTHDSPANQNKQFAIITPPIISGAFTERIAYLPYMLFIIGFSILVYCPIVRPAPSPLFSFPSCIAAAAAACRQAGPAGVSIAHPPTHFPPSTPRPIT